ncbi:MAG: hypothetical protein KME57_26395, partial [Scytonema hyalinum WJT4-NPBG1]|nr:hypothetical protein [Scytonema hyalinum WJT4-NPBG1]
GRCVWFKVGLFFLTSCSEAVTERCELMCCCSRLFYSARSTTGAKAREAAMKCHAEIQSSDFIFGLGTCPISGSFDAKNPSNSCLL